MKKTLSKYYHSDRGAGLRVAAPLVYSLQEKVVDSKALLLLHSTDAARGVHLLADHVIPESLESLALFVTSRELLGAGVVEAETCPLRR